VIAYLGYWPLPAPITLGERIRRARYVLDWPKTNLARRLGCDEETLSLWEEDVREPALASHKAAVQQLLAESALAHDRLHRL
jgi:transcriptional regulator with XRE-family HTH domain